MAFDLSTATPVDEVPKDDSGLLPKPNDFPAVTKRAKQNKETDVQRLEQLVTPDLTEAAALVPGVASDFGSQAGNLGQGAFNYIKEHPLASAAVGGAAALGGQAVYKTLKDKILGGKTPNASPNAEPELFSRIDPDLNVSQKPVVRPEPTFDMQGMTPAQPVAQSTPTTIEELKARLTATPEVSAPEVDPKFAKSDALLADINNELKSLKETIPDFTEVSAKASPKGANAPVKPKKQNLAEIANNPVEIPEQPGMRTQYDVPKTKGSIAINPATGEKYMGPGGYNWFASQVGHEAAPKRWEEQYGQKNVPHKQVQEDYAATRYPPTSETVSAKGGGSAGKPEFIPKYIKGAAAPSALATTAVMTALPALGVAAYQKYKGNESAVDASIQEAKDSLKSLATMPYDVSKAALKGDFGPLKDLMLSMNPGSLLFNEMNKNDEEIIKKMIQKEKAGVSRGIAPPTR
jgi:hypothetical protein